MISKEVLNKGEKRHADIIQLDFQMHNMIGLNLGEQNQSTAQYSHGLDEYLGEPTMKYNKVYMDIYQ